MDKIINDFSVGLFFWQTILFLALLFLLRKFAWNPILNAVNEREKSIEDALNSAEDDNLGLFNVQDERVMQRLNGFVGAIAQQEYMQPDAAMKQLNNKLNVVGLNFVEPKIESDKGNATVELTQFGGRYGKTSDNSNGPMSCLLYTSPSPRDS